MNNKFLSLTAILSIFLLAACSGADSRIDGSSEATFESSLISMFPEMKGVDGDISDESMENMPPALEVVMCYQFKELLSNFGRGEEEGLAVVRNALNGMNRADLISFGEDNDLIGCFSEMKKGAIIK
jgi:hypothetical protein